MSSESTCSTQVDPIFSIISLPGEVVEEILLMLAEYPSSIAAFAQSCASFYALIYRASDDHFWRELFLAIYDDPRAVSHLSLPAPRRETLKPEWKNSFQQRAQALNGLTKPKECSILEIESQQSTSTIGDRYHLFLALLSMIKGAPQAISLVPTNSCPISRFLRGNHRDGVHPLVIASQNTFKLPPPQWFSEIGPSKNVRILDHISLPDMSLLLDECHRTLEVLRRPGFNHPPANYEACEFVTIYGWPETYQDIRAIEDGGPKSTPSAFLDAHHKVFSMEYPRYIRAYGPFLPREGEVQKSSDLKPDWEHLAAVRLVVQSAIVTELGAKSHPILRGAAATRPRAWIPPFPGPEGPESLECGKITHDRDWAGVEGIWRYELLCIPTGRIFRIIIPQENGRLDTV